VRMTRSYSIVRGGESLSTRPEAEITGAPCRNGCCDHPGSQFFTLRKQCHLRSDQCLYAEGVPCQTALIDHRLPEMDGCDATGEIRRRENGSGHTTIIAMTVNAMQGDREKCLEAGMDDYISRPIKKEDVVAIVNKCVAQTSLQRGD
jgi:CheY-like chemotaxis protein